MDFLEKAVDDASVSSYASAQIYVLIAIAESFASIAESLETIARQSRLH